MDRERVDQIIDRHGGEASSLLQVLLEIQAENRWLPAEALERVGERLGVPPGKVRHIASFYKALSLVPTGRHEVHVCTGTSCHVRGARGVLETVRDATGAVPGETDPESKFRLRKVNCLGCCALGPVVVVDGKTHGGLTPSEASEVIKRYE